MGIEKCGKTLRHFSNCGSKTNACFYIPSFTFSLKIPTAAFKSFESDLCESGWTLNFEFGISKKRLFEEQTMSIKGEKLGYLNSSFDIWQIHSLNNTKHEKNDF